MDSGELAALYSMQHGLAGDAEKSSGFEHGHMALWRFGNKAGTNLLIDTNAPWGTRGDLFAGNETVGEPTVHGGRRHAEDFCCSLERHQFAFGGDGGRVESRDFPIPAQVTDLVNGEPIAIGRASALPV